MREGFALNDRERAVIEAAKAWRVNRFSLTEPKSEHEELAAAVDALEANEPNEPDGMIQKRPWSRIPAGWFVFPPRVAGAAYEVLRTEHVSDGQRVTIRQQGATTELTHTYPHDREVVCRPGSKAPAVDAALDALGPGVEIIEDQVS
jgi:hypothetical protein